jgi:diacylglycerol kinase family enzyme
MSSPIPAFVNPEAGTADDVAGAIARSGQFALHEVQPDKLREAVAAAARSGVSRVLVAGGDGTIATAASELAGTHVELAVVPAGTLNHFAKGHGIPVDPSAAVALAAQGSARPVDVGYVDGRLFLNTSSVGEYVSFVQVREKLEPRLSYGIASLVASWRVFTAARPFRLELDLEGQRRLYRTSLAFIGVGERELRLPIMGGLVPGGRPGLHVIIPRARTRPRLLLTALVAALRGVRAAEDELRLDSFLVDHCRLTMRRPELEVSLDGELVPLRAPLEYRVGKGVLKVVTGESGE